MKYKLIVSDFDDTLVDDDQIIKDSTIRAIHDFEARGGRFVLCTGRMISAIRPHAIKMGLHGEIIGYQGGVVADVDTGAFLVEHAVPFDKALRVAKYLEEHGLYFQLYEKDTFVIEKENEYSDLYRKFTFLPPIVTGERLSEYMLRTSLAPTKILLINEPERIPVILGMLQKEFGSELLINSSKRFIIEIVPLGINKGTAVRELGRRLGVSEAETITVGDGLNDLPLLSYGGLRVAVENANPRLKEKASVIAPSCREEPIKWIIESYCK